MLSVQRKQDILEKLAAEQASSQGTNTVLRILGSQKLGFGDVKASKQTAKAVPGQEVLHSGGKWAQQALAHQEARIGIRPNVPTPGAAYLAKTARTQEVTKRTAPAIWAKTKSILGFGAKPAKKAKSGGALARAEARLGISPGQVTHRAAPQWARVIRN